MEQPEHPPDVSLALNRPRTLHPTVLRAVQPYPKLDASWGFLHYPADAASRDFTQILGVEYTLLDLIELSEDQTPDDQLLDNSDGAVIRFLRMNPADRRMQYRYWLERALQVANRQQSPDFPWLMGEHLHWTGRDLDEMNAKLGPPHGLPYSIDVLRSQPEACWVWQRPLDPGRKYPTTASWRGMQHITVHRLLWPIVKPELPFRSRPARDCGNNLCVNPLHFYDSSARARAFNMGPGKGKRSEDEVKTANTIPFYMEDVVALGEGKFELRCPRCKTLASDYYQALVNRSIAQGWWGNKNGKMGTLFCRFCHGVYMAARNAKRPVPRLNNPKRGLTEAERFDLEFKEKQIDDDWGPASNWRTSPELLEETEQESLPPGFTTGWPEGYKPG